MKKYPEYPSLSAPAVFIEEKEKLHQLLESGVLNSYQSLYELKDALMHKLSEYDQYYHSDL